MKILVPPLWDYEKHGPGNVVEWFKKEGEETGENDLLCQIMVVKAINNVYAEKPGTLTRILAPLGAEVKPGDELAEISEGAPQTVGMKSGEKEAPSRETTVRIAATPSARRLAREKGIELSTVRGTGKNNSITAEDVQAALQAHIAGEVEEGGEYTARPLSGVRKAISDTMMKSLSGSAQLTLHTTADVTELVKLKRSSLSDSSISYNDLVCYFTVKALRDHGYMNAHLVDGKEIRVFSHVNLGVSVQTDEGLYSVVVKNAERQDLKQLERSIGSLVEKARGRSASVGELTGSTFTVSNLGMAGIDHFTPILNPPEIGILGVGAIRDYPAVTGNGLEFRKNMGLSLTIDHRAVDGYNGALFLKRLKEILENPRDHL